MQGLIVGNLKAYGFDSINYSVVTFPIKSKIGSNLRVWGIDISTETSTVLFLVLLYSILVLTITLCLLKKLKFVLATLYTNLVQTCA